MKLRRDLVGMDSHPDFEIMRTDVRLGIGFLFCLC